MQGLVADATAAATTAEAFANQLTTTELIASSATFAPNTNITTKGYTTSGDGGSGSWIQNGVTGQTVSQSPAQLGNALLNDASGNQWALVGGEVNIKSLGGSIQAALNSGLVIDFTGSGANAITTQLTCSQDINFKCSDDSSITGYDGLGVLFSGSSITLEGINVVGFYDGTEENKTNFATGFIRIATGTTVNLIKVIGGISTNCRTVIRAGAATSDTTTDVTIIINRVIIDSNKIDGCPMAYHFRCRYIDVKITNNTCLNAISSSNGLTPYQFYLDGLGFDDPTYKLIGNLVFSGNYANTIVNRTTTGDSSPGNAYECHFLKASGEKITITDNIVIDCTGVTSDCESFYTKARYVVISDNVIIDGGSNEGAINIKGNASDAAGTNTSPFGEYSIISGNHIVFTRDSYNNNGTVVALETIGIHAAVPERCIIKGNIFSGANEGDIVLDGVVGTLSSNNSVIVSDNISYGNKGEFFTKFRGAFQSTKCHDNICDNVFTDAANFYMFYMISVSNRGELNLLNSFTDNSLRLGYDTSNETGFRHSFLAVDIEYYEYELVVANDNIIDIASTPASTRPIYVLSQSSSPTGSVNSLVVKGNTFANGHYILGPLFFSKIPLSLDLDLSYDWVSTANTAADALTVVTANNTQLDADLRVFSSRVDVSGQAQRDISNFLGYTAADTLNSISNVAETAIGNGVGIGITLATLEDYLRVRISGSDGETWLHKINLKCKNG